MNTKIYFGNSLNRSLTLAFALSLSAALTARADEYHWVGPTTGGVWDLVNTSYTGTLTWATGTAY
ncbi:MAG: hypothetical protein LBK60_00055 [Verrucomicrobiales bacterium]|nr:hypothetical protein [Verrucomicrobiales bacterium]